MSIRLSWASLLKFLLKLLSRCRLTASIHLLMGRCKLLSKINSKQPVRLIWEVEVMVLAVPNPAPNQHMLGSVLESTSSWAVDKGKTTVRAFTANGAGTSTTIVGANAQASAASLKVGDRVRLYVAANTLKDILL